MIGKDGVVLTLGLEVRAAVHHVGTKMRVLLELADLSIFVIKVSVQTNEPQK